MNFAVCKLYLSKLGLQKGFISKSLGRVNEMMQPSPLSHAQHVVKIPKNDDETTIIITTLLIPVSFIK